MEEDAAEDLRASFWSEHWFFFFVVVHLPPCFSLEEILSDVLHFILS